MTAQPSSDLEPARVVLADFTTLRVGGPARRLIEAGDEPELVEQVAAADRAGEPLLVLGGGSNLVIADAGFAGSVLHVGTRGFSTAGDADGRVRLTVAAGEPWDRVVERACAAGLAGIECLSGIPGSTGATPIQNVGAYGQQVSDVIASVRVYDRERAQVLELGAAECRFGYRTSAFRHRARHVVLSVTFALERTIEGRARPLRYAELARVLDASPGAQPPLAEVRQAVLALRRGKGMVLDPDDPDSVSAGSFFVNPIVDPEAFAALARQARERLGEAVQPPAWPEPDGRIKTSAAWLIERAGFTRGFGEGHVGISSKHTLALVNRGGATTAELLALAREIRAGVQEAFGIELHPEPTLIGVEL